MCPPHLKIDEAKLAQIGTHGVRHLAVIVLDYPQIGWCIGHRQISPALKGAPCLCAGRHKLRIEHDAAAGGAVILDVGPEVEHPLTDEDDALDHPIERSAVEHLVPASRRPHGAMAELQRLPGMLGLPEFELLHSVDTDAELNEMDRHSWLRPPDNVSCSHPIPPIW